jgi:hypothetical protein
LHEDSSLEIPKTKQRRYMHKQTLLEPCVAKGHTEPDLKSMNQPTESTNVFNSEPGVYNVSELLWTICRGVGNQKCTVPSWTGWVSVVADEEEIPSPSTVGYMSPVLHPITESDTVLHCLVSSMERCVGQKYTFVTFDLAAAKIMFNIVWDNPEKFKDVFIHLGAFHIMCSYMSALGKKMTGSGSEEIVINSGVCASGSIHQVMSGKHCNRAVRVHQLMVDAIGRLLIDSFNKEGHQPLTSASLLVLATSPSHVQLREVWSDVGSMEQLEKFAVFIQQVRNGYLGKTAQFWLAYWDAAWSLLRFLKAVKENDLNQYVKSIRELCDLIFSADHLNYARYLPLCYVKLCDLMQNKPDARALLEKHGISVARYTVPSCRVPIDLTIEQTINRSAKTAGGVVGFSRNADAYYRWCLTRLKRAEFLEAILENLDMTDNGVSIHKTLRPAELKKSEADVQNILHAIDTFINPFNVSPESKDELFCVSSGKPACQKVSDDLTTYVTTGIKASDEFITNRLCTDTVKFHDRMPKLKLSTFNAMASAKTITTSKHKTILVKAERNLLGQLLLLSQEHDISLDKLFTYPLSPIPWSLSTPDGSFYKTNKAQLMHHLEAITAEHNIQSAATQIPFSWSCIVDGNALIHFIVRSPETFGDFATVIFIAYRRLKHLISLLTRTS